MKLNEQGEITDPNVGDAELVRLGFDPQGIDLHIKLALSEEVFVLRLVTPRWMSFSMTCPQNVIDRIIVRTDLKEVAALAPQHIREMMLIREQEFPGQADTAPPLKAIHIMPTAGPELVCIADGVVAIRVSEGS